MHGRRVPPGMGRYSAPRQPRTLRRRGRDREGKSVGHIRASHRSPAAVGDQGLVCTQVCILQPVTDFGRRLLPQRHGSLLAPLALQAHRGRRGERDIGHPDADHFGNSRAGVVEQREHDPITVTTSGARVGGGENGLNLIAGEILEQGPLEAFHGYRQDLLCV